jgi:hypothetical protein
MLKPEDISSLDTNDLTDYKDGLGDYRHKQAIMRGIGRGSEVAHGPMTAVLASAGVLSEKPIMFALAGICATGATLGHILHRGAENNELAADFDMSVINQELWERGIDT